MNGPYHIFGQHTKCEKYFCNGSKQTEKNLIPEISNCGLMKEIAYILRRIVDNARSLFDVDNNYCEQFNSIINKYIGGKRINFSQKQSYNIRVQAAIVAFNSGGEFIRAIHKNITNHSPGKLINCDYSLKDL